MTCVELGMGETATKIDIVLLEIKTMILIQGIQTTMITIQVLTEGKFLLFCIGNAEFSL